MAIDDYSSDYNLELESWLSGNLEFQIKAAEIRSQKYPELFRYLSTERNRKIAERLNSSIAKYDKQFLCFGIGHLVGRDSIQEMLQRLGFEIKRL